MYLGLVDDNYIYERLAQMLLYSETLSNKSFSCQCDHQTPATVADIVRARLDTSPVNNNLILNSWLFMWLIDGHNSLGNFNPTRNIKILI